MEKLEQEKIKETRTEKLLRELKLDAVDFQDEKLPTKVFSYSQYTSFKVCARAYEFKYIEKQPMPNYAPLVRGVSVHAGIESLLRAKMAGKPIGLDAAMAVADSRFEEASQTVLDWHLHDDDETKNTPETVRQQVHDLLRVFTAEGLRKINPLGIEEGFAKKVGGVPMVGWIDLVDSQPMMDVSHMTPKEALGVPRKTVIVDFKTTAKSWSAAQIRNSPQMTLYAAVKGTPYIRIDQLVTTKKVKYIASEAERTPQDIEILAEDLGETTEFIKKGVFPKCAVDNWCCNPKHCSWWDKCRGKKKT